MKIKLFTKNVDIATIAAFGGLTLMPMFPLFLGEHGLRYSAITLVITLWGFLSLKQIDTQQDIPKLKKQHRRKTVGIVALIAVIGGALLFGTIDATQIQMPDLDMLDCEQRIREECGPRGQKPICPNLNPIPRCPLEQSDPWITQ